MDSARGRAVRRPRLLVTAVAIVAVTVPLAVQPMLGAETTGIDAAPTESPTAQPPTQSGGSLWDYRAVFVVWDEQAQDWRADWNDGSNTVGLEAVLDSEGTVGWELVGVAHERFDLVVGQGTTQQEARRLRLLFKRALGDAVSVAEGTDAQPSPAALGGALVTVRDFSFQPAWLGIETGTTVTWENQDVTAHTATSSDGTFDSGAVAPATSFSLTFEEAGEFVYVCAIHPQMSGTIVVG